MGVGTIAVVRAFGPRLRTRRSGSTARRASLQLPAGAGSYNKILTLFSLTFSRTFGYNGRSKEDEKLINKYLSTIVKGA